MVEYSEIATLSSIKPSTYFFGFRERKIKPQNVKPKPMKAKIEDPLKMETIKDNTPDRANNAPILKETVFTSLLSEAKFYFAYPFKYTLIIQLNSFRISFPLRVGKI